MLSPLFAFADNIADLQNQPSFKTTEEILAEYRSQRPTDCATAIFSKALINHRNEIADTADENSVRIWAKTVMSSSDVLKQVLNCPEIKNASEEETIVFTPIEFQFKRGDTVTRTLTINYSTQPKVLLQKWRLSLKPSMPTNNPSPKLMDPNDPGKYLNTEPAWYAVMVVQHDSVKDFVGPDKNNTLSMKYLNDHIGSIYPKGYHCTSRSAIALDSDTINQVTRLVVNLDDDTNDYYVAGDINLEWIMYAEIAADIILTVATMGGGQLLTGSMKGMRATKTGMRLAKNMNKLEKFEHVQKYVKTTSKIEHLENYEQTLKAFEKAKSAGKDVTKYEKELDEARKALKRIDPDMADDVLKNSDNIAKELKNSREAVDKLTDVSKELKEQRKLMDQARKAADPLSVEHYDKKLKELGALRDAQESGTTIARIKDPEKKAKAMEQFQAQEKRIKELENEIKSLETNSSLGDYPKYRNKVDELESVGKYLEQSKQFENIIKYHNSLRALRRPQTGNLLTRNLKKIIPGIKTLRAVNSGARTLRKAERVARAGMSSRSSRFLYWLFDATLANGSRLGKIESKIGKYYGAVTLLKFLGDMYDYTSTTSKEFSNGIEFKPFCLLSADDIKGQENVVNYGMWLMWAGNSVDPADDDAAYLQAMDFASKFYYKLDEFQEEHGAECNVDIYVVHPIIRLDETNKDDPKGELYYLFMNEIPWSTAEQFGQHVQNYEEWERKQLELERTDPDHKYSTPESNNNNSSSNNSSSSGNNSGSNNNGGSNSSTQQQSPQQEQNAVIVATPGEYPATFDTGTQQAQNVATDVKPVEESIIERRDINVEPASNDAIRDYHQETMRRADLETTRMRVE